MPKPSPEQKLLAAPVLSPEEEFAALRKDLREESAHVLQLTQRLDRSDGLDGELIRRRKNARDILDALFNTYLVQSGLRPTEDDPAFPQAA